MLLETIEKVKDLCEKQNGFDDELLNLPPQEVLFAISANYNVPKLS